MTNPDYFTQLEPHHFRLEQTDEGPVLRLHADDDGRYLGVYVAVEFRLSPEAYATFRLDAESRRALEEWFRVENEKPF